MMRWGKERGFNLIENLVTLFILTVGLLGVAGMQAVALKTHQQSSQYDRALALAQEMADRIRANRDGASLGYYDMELTGSPVTIAEDSDCIGSGCSTADMAGHDLWEWKRAVERELPAGFAVVCRDTTPSFDASTYVGDPQSVLPASCDSAGETYVIHLAWDMDRHRDGVLELTSSAETTDGHLMLVFEP